MKLKRSRPLTGPNSGTAIRKAVIPEIARKELTIMSCEPLITADQAAENLNCSPKTVKRMAARGEIPAMQIGNRWRFRPSLLDEFIRHQLLSTAPSVSEKGRA